MAAKIRTDNPSRFLKGAIMEELAKRFQKIAESQEKITRAYELIEKAVKQLNYVLSGGKK